MEAGPFRTDTAAPLLLQPLTLRGLTFKNRIVVSPMATYGAVDGMASDFHLVHLGRFALGGAGLVMTEATAITEQGRITHGCLGLWQDGQIAPFRRLTDFLHAHGALAGIQLGHSGAKGAGQRPWHGNGPLGDPDRTAREETPWPLVAATSEAFDNGFPVPAALDESAMDALVADYCAAAHRAQAAGFDVLELHCAHGYLLHGFLSPLGNRRDDAYGGSLANRMRFPLRVAQALRRVWPEDRPLFVRVSAIDGVDFGWSLDDTVAFAAALKRLGIDLVDCSTGGMRVPREHGLPARAPGFQVPFAEGVRARAGIATMAVGLIRDAAQAEAILRAGSADLIALGREMLSDPNWAAKATVALAGETGWTAWPQAFGWWLQRRARLDRPKAGE
ncbi:MAG: NADH:flavin oxidoreductase/NADH oxidase [Bosea sp. (in: a-proteobacteria)]|uniref:NADH:flavin oxidoreductase/NADH oxidase n=1 Tax=Bosea sp. (in: a-proteobacteria) TaxID=1871050 RepID=UPI002733ECDE|nr:NADH:flavin oxidoreductase/NADH oxidase [Bosea sp. (in: a-proteobacteria)]MDP3600546.1 NADH:flavin oxidoreductase/NADH oxidase [Bosea sp. (in: a-proteobacteria)]